MAKSKTHHIVPNPSGGWDVKRGGAKKASVHLDTKQEAVNAGTWILTPGLVGDDSKMI